MASVTVVRTVAAPIERVWEILTDVEGLPGVIEEITCIERLDGPDGFEVGARWKETRKILGRQATEEMVVTSADHLRSFRVEAESHGAHYAATHFLEQDAAGTKVTLTFSAVPVSRIGKLLGKVTGPIFRSATTRALSSDLAQVAAAAENGTAETAGSRASGTV